MSALQNQGGSVTHIELEKIYKGILKLRLCLGGDEMEIIFNGKEYDGIPGLVQMYVSLYQHVSYDFVLVPIGIAFELDYYQLDLTGTETVIFTIRDEGETIFEEIPRETLMRELESFFHAVLLHPNFPFHYPYYEELRDRYCDRVHSAMTQICAYMRLSDDEIHILKEKLFREYVIRFQGDCSEKNVLYRNMLIKLQVPDGWEIHRRHGSEVRHLFSGPRLF